MFHVLFCTGIIFHNEKGLKSIYTYALFSGGIQWQTVNGGWGTGVFNLNTIFKARRMTTWQENPGLTANDQRRSHSLGYVQRDFNMQLSPSWTTDNHALT